MAAEAHYYDDVYVRAGPRTTRSAPWFPLWTWIAARLEPHERVLDLGCGPGHLAELAEVESYTGIDFSAIALGQARARVPLARATFRFGVLPDCIPEALRAAPTVVVLSEVLEHLDDDQGTLKALPAGMRVLGTLPTFDDPAHERFFVARDAVDARYAGQLAFETLDSAARHWWAFEARIRRPR